MIVKQLAILCLFLTGALGHVGLAQQPPPEPDPAPQTTPTRVPGQAGSPQEMEAFKQLAATQAREERIRLGNAFLANYPNSGLSSYVHHILANAYGFSDPQQYVTHAEAALVELPNSPSLLATLAFIYAETGKTELGAERGKAALELLETLEKPPQLSDAAWLMEKMEIGGQSNYAIGRYLLGQADPEKPDHEEKLQQASQYLFRAMEQLPDDPYSAFRLAETYLQMEEDEKALTYFARTAAVGGSVGEIADRRVRELYEIVHSNSDGLEELLAKQKEALEKAREARRNMLQAVTEQTSNTQPGTPPPGS